MDIKNKVCIVTGSAQGLGKEFARVLLEHGAKVCLSDLEEQTGFEREASVIKEFRGIFGKENVCYVKCDVTKEDEFIALFDETEKYFKIDCIDMLVNNAGINGISVGWKKCMNVNIMGVLTGTDIALKRIKAKSKKGASIINTASMAGFATGMGEKAVGYSASKHGAVALTRTLAKDFEPHGTSIKAICPAWTDTNIVASAKEHASQLGRLSELEKRIKGVGGLMTPKHVANGFYKLVTECQNGDVMAVIKDTPYFIVPDDAELKVTMLAVIAMIIGKITGNKLIYVFQQKIFVSIFLVFMIIFINCIF